MKQSRLAKGAAAAVAARFIAPLKGFSSETVMPRQRRGTNDMKIELESSVSRSGAIYRTCKGIFG